MAVAQPNDGSTDGTGHTAKDKRATQRQSQAINRRFGDAKDPGGYRRAGQHFLPRIAGAQEYSQRRPDLPHHRRQQHRQHRVLSQHRQIINHQGDQPPVQAKNNAYLPQRPHRRARQPRRDRVDNLVAVGQQLT